MTAVMREGSATAARHCPALPRWLDDHRCPVCDHSTNDACTCTSDADDGCGCVAHCTVCGHRWRLRPPAALLEGSHYGADYHTHRKVEGRAGFALKEDTFLRHLATFRRWCGDLTGRRLLDVGCATGDFLVAARRVGADVHGIELSSFAAARASERGVPVRCGRIDDVDEGPYDLLHSSHVLEHVPDVGSFAARAFELVRPGGLALIEVPNEFDDALSTTRRAAGLDDERRAGSPHLHYFTAASLRRLFEHVGFVERELFTYSHRRPAEPALAIAARLRHVMAANALLTIGDAVGRGRNLVLLVGRA